MSTYSAVFTNPKYNYTGGSSGASNSIPVSTLSKEEQFGEISQLTLNIETDVLANYDIENLETNPCQLNSTVVVKRTYGAKTSIFFSGYVYEKPFLSDGDNILNIKVRGREGVLGHTLCADSLGNYEWSCSSDNVRCANVRVDAVTLSAKNEFDTYFYPNPTGTFSCAISSAMLNSYMFYDLKQDDNIKSAISAGTTTISLAGKVYLGIGASNFAKIGSEWIWFDGCGFNSKGYFELRNCKRGAIGTTAASHLANASVTFRSAKEIAPDVGITFERAKDDKFTTSLAHYALQQTSPLEGKFIIAPDGYYYRGDYAVYDVDATIDGTSKTLKLAGVVASICKSPASFGGAAFRDSDLSCVSSAIAITRVDYSPEQYDPFAWETIQGLIEGAGLVEEYGFHYNHAAGKLSLAVITQKTVTVDPATEADMCISQCSAIATERNLNDVYSGVMVKYSSQTKMNALNKDWIYRDNAASGNTGLKDQEFGDNPDYVIPHRWWVHNNGANGTPAKDSYYAYNEPVADPTGVSLVVSPAGLVAGHEGARWPPKYDEGKTNKILAERPLHYCYGWFGDDYPSVSIDEFKIVLWTRMKGSYRFTVQGTQEEPMSGGVPVRDDSKWFDLSPELGNVTGTCDDSEGSSATHSTTEFPIKKIKGFRILVHECGGIWNHTMFQVGQIMVVTSIDNYKYYELVETTSDYGDVVAPVAYEKLRGGVNSSKGVAGAAKVGFIDAGVCTDNEAAAVAYNFLVNNVKLYEARSYTYEGELSRMPNLGDTVHVKELSGNTYTGILRGCQCNVDADGVEWTFDVLDYNAKNLGE